MNKSNQFFVLYDSQIFDQQRFGGISRYFCEIINRLNMKQDIAVRYSMNYYLTTYRLGKRRIPLPRFILKHYRKLYQKKNKDLGISLLTKSKNYLFHPTYYDPYFLKYIGSNPFVVTVHDMIYERFFSYSEDVKEIIRQKKEVITHANRIIAISNNTKNDIIKLLNINPNKIDVIYHSTSMKPFVGSPSLELPTRFLLFVGERGSYKNFDRFIKVFAKINKQDKELFLVCTGMPFHKSEKATFNQLNITDKVLQFKATDKLLSELYSRAELFVFPSLYEGFGIPILESYVCKCPIAISKTSCFPEIAGNAASYFDPYSEDSIEDAIKKVIYNPKKRQDLIQLGNERLKLYSWENATRQTEETYKKAMFTSNQL